MDTQGLIAGPLSVLCIVALVMGTASAAMITATEGTPGSDPLPIHQHPSPESIIQTLEQQGVDVTEVQADLQNGDIAAVQAWLEAYFQAHRPEKPEGGGRSTPDLMNSTRQHEIVTKLEAEGVDVSEVKTSLQNGDTDAVKTWLEAYFQTHRPERPDGSGRSHPDLTNVTQQQEIITRLEEEGVDITEAKTALGNGDTDAVKTWLEAYFQTHRPVRTPPDLTDPAQEQRILDRLENQGVDVTEVEADLQNGDTTAVQTWLETYLHSHEGEMGFHHPPGESQALNQSVLSEQG